MYSLVVSSLHSATTSYMSCASKFFSISGLALKVVAMILSKGSSLRDYTKDVENNLRQVELESIEVLLQCRFR